MNSAKETLEDFANKVLEFGPMELWTSDIDERRKVQQEAQQALYEQIIEIVGEDIAIGNSKVIWDGKGGVRAERADDLRWGWINGYRAELRQKLREYFGQEPS